MGNQIIPTLSYRDAPAMIEWLGTALGFEPRLVVEDGKGGIAHAQLTRGEAMIMLGSARDDEFGQLQRLPADLGGTTQSPYLIVDDVDGLCVTARSAGANVVVEPRDQEHGGRFFSCLDPEGHLWNVGSYDPWAKP